ncbi:hypothetical protein [Roseateles amylovorans]|uniref:Uncharacterized protein n=1 Tax=Roseateles amylovorans TaxID=2978473 RepID=A0ABY6B4P0_9BURK|nr:hypothetical protein [Roseateles amylovorans]UXH79706.1 hypothetical protein N4261_07290 [Roseateles amylovorans]
MVTAFIYLKLPTHALPRDHQWEDRLDGALRQAGAGTVIGWGESLGDAPPGQMRPLAFLRVDIETNDLASARQLLHDWLPVAGVPQGTELHYTLDRRALQDRLEATGWRLALDGHPTARRAPPR